MTPNPRTQTTNLGHYTYTTTVEVIGPKDITHDLEIAIILQCTAHGSPGILSGPPERCYPAEAAEFDVDCITIRGVIHKTGQTPLPIEPQTLRYILGDSLDNILFETACEEANETGEF